MDDVTAGMTEKQRAEFMKFRSEMCESKALNRALRTAMQIKSSYLIEEFKKPFVVAYLVPNLDNPAVREEAVKSMFGAANDLYGSRPKTSHTVYVDDDDDGYAQPEPDFEVVPEQPQQEQQPERPAQRPRQQQPAPSNRQQGRNGDSEFCADCGKQVGLDVAEYDGISFATINGENGAGKSSLFMDAMLDALFEEPREGDLTGWICNDPDARSGSIKFTFYLGDKLYRVTRTRTKSGKATLNLSEYVDESWQNRSAEKYRDTQTIIENTIGMDSLTLKATGLIMQDQYGLFLQADKADRMAILGNILGLGIYDRMESMAANRAADANRELRRIADLQEETGRAMPDKATVEATMNKTAIEKASAVADRAIHTKAMSEAQTKLDIAKQAQKRSEKLTSELGSWIAEKNANASAQAVCRAQISDAQALLDKREEVEAGSRSYGKLSARREELLGTAALIQPKEEKLRDVMAALSTQRKKKSSLEAEKLSAQATCWSYEQALADYEELERKAADLAGASERLAALEEQDEQYLAADQEAMKLLQTKNAETARIQSWLGIKESEVVHIRSRAIMLETCGCPVENPECRFLQDAVEAKKKLPTAETELETYRQQAEERAEQLDAEYQAAKKKATNLNCRKDLQAQRFLVADLRKASERFAKLTAQKERLAEVKERIKAIDEELETIPANIEGLEADRFVVEDELKKLRQNAAELASIEAQLSDVKKYIELEKLLPAAEATATPSRPSRNGIPRSRLL